MAIAEMVSLSIQNKLRDLLRDDWTFAIFVFWQKQFIDTPNAHESILAWQTSVDFILRCLKSRLVKVIHYDHYSNQDALLDDLRHCNPFVYQGESRPGDYAWNGVFVCGTDALAAIAGRFFQNDDEYATIVNKGFIEAIEQAFEAAGVPWSETPLTPVVP